VLAPGRDILAAVRLFHITSEEEWRAAQASGEYRPQAFSREGFIHCSYAGQVLRTANRIFKGVRDLVLLEIDPARLSCAVVDENLEGGAELFPHVYGPLPVSAVRAVHPLPCGADGTFSRQRLSSAESPAASAARPDE
jgi:uncharacterized protein (DUF952 family)